MPQLQDTREIIKVSLKSIEGSEIELRDGLLAGDMDYVYGDGLTSDVERSLRAFSKMLVSWNLTDANNQPLPTTLENIKRLNLEDVIEVMSHTSFGQKEREVLGKKKRS